MTRSLRSALALVLVLVAVDSASAELVRLEVRQREPYANGREFDRVGPYERLQGRAHFAVDPQSPANAQIVDLALAPRNEQGKVEFWADFEVLAPRDRTKARGTLLYDVNNRGRRLAPGRFNDGADEFLLRHGFVVVWSGWIAQVLPGDDRPLLSVPVVRPNGQVLTSLVREEIVVDEPTDRHTVAQWANQGSHPPTESGLAGATLTWRLRERDPRVAIPREQFKLEVTHFEVDGQLRPLPLVELVLSGGFQPGYIYELIYEAQDPVVQGLGLAGIRDLVSFLKHESSEQNPLRPPDGRLAAERAIGFGVSQSGRCLRLFLYDGFNADEQRRRVFDGLMPNVAGAGLGFFNHRFASPTRHNGQHDNHLYPADIFPFTYGDSVDPFSQRTDGILRRARESNTVPKVMHVDTSAEYWHRSGSLVHTDPLGTRDAVIPPEVRIYAIGGSQHSAGNGIAGKATTGQLPHNPTDYRPLLRGLLMALDAWAHEETEPPASVYPRIADGTLVGWTEASSGWRALPGVRYPEVIQQPGWVDYGPEFLTQRWITRHPPQVRFLPANSGSKAAGEGSREALYGVRVPAYGPDNNELGMLELPAISVPVATYTGWNLRHRSIGAESELLGLAGGYVPFARTRAEREARGDPRPALAERYRDFDDYLRQYRAAAEKLVAQRYLLAEDLPLLLEQARKHRPLFAE